MNTLESEIFSFIIIIFVVVLLAFFTQKLQNKNTKE
jgi:Sec-independent protein translocase protein TatA